jgi:hypothetical protein
MPGEEAAQNVGVAAPQQSFTERKAAQLREEREARSRSNDAPIQREAPDYGTPPGDDGISEDVEQDLTQGLYADEEGDQGALEDSSEALEDEIPSDEEQGAEAGDVDWEKRYNDLRSETQSILESRGEMDQEHAEAMSQHLQLRFEMEDRLQEAVQRAEYMRNVMAGNAQQYQNINWAQVPADKVQEVQAQAQQAFAMAQQADQVWNQMSQEVQQQKELIKQREAAIAKTRLRRTIPNWSNETYAEIRDFAANAGMPASEFNEITNPVIIEALHAYRQLKSGSSGVGKTQTTRKSQAPRGKAARRQPRDERGKFARKQTVPNERGSFADKHRHRLAMERQGR